MTDTKKLLTRRLAASALIGIALAFPVGIAAHTNEQLAKTGGMTATLPLLGASLTVEVKLDVVGNISEVNLDPTGTVAQTSTGDHKVKFASADGSVKVDVKAKNNKLSIKARAGSLADLVGSGTWSAAVFGPGTESSVPYTIGNAGGHPTLTIGTPSVPAGVTAEVSPIKTGDDGNKASGRVTFQSEGYTKTLTISVHVDEDGKASLKITLRGKDKQRLSGPIADLVGDRSWSAHLCDGTPVTVNFKIAADGTVTFVSSDPAGAAVKDGKNGFKATFAGSKVRVSVKLKQDEGGDWTLKVDGKSGKCGGPKDKDKSEHKAGKHKDKSEAGDAERDGRETESPEGDD